MLIFTFHACTHMVAAGDTWVAMACGRHFVNHGVNTVEPFSANSHKAGPTQEEIKTWPEWAQWIVSKVGLETVKYWHPTGWVNQNWLTHVIFYSLVPKSSYADGVSFTSNALVYWKFAIYILTVICVYYTGRLLGVHPVLCAVFSCFAMFTGRSFLDVRPAGFSNMLVAVFLLILVLAAYRNILYIWLIVPLSVFWCGVHGGYIYTFIMLIPFIGLHLLTNCNRKWTAILYNVTAWPFLYFVVSKAGLTISTFLFIILLIVLDFALIFFKRNLVSIGSKGVYHSIAAYFVAFLAVILFNPFHLTNLTHTFAISASKHAERWRNIHEWHPAFAWDNPVGTAVPFLVMYIIAWVALASWIVVLKATSNSVRPRAKRKADNSQRYQWPKIDLSLMLIAALTIYMAIRSRRFIPIAAIVACPIIAMFIDQIIRAISATRNFRKHNRLTVSPMSVNVQLIFILAGAAAVLFFGTWWGAKFKRVYLDPWPADPKLNSVFMRMTASDAKPFYTLKFIKDNKLKGKMFNYWTEGGFIAFGQEPDPNTGRTPLQLFMDGRAQAAYDRRAFDLWSYIMAGGPPGSTGQQIIQAATMRARAARKNIKEILTGDDYRNIGQSIGQALKERDVWVVLMPFGQFDSIFVKALQRNGDWFVVFLNNKQKLFVDITTPQGKAIFENMDDKTVYPDDFSKSLALAHKKLLSVPELERERQQIARVQKSVKAKFDNEVAVIKAKEKELAQFKGNLTQLSEQLKTLQQRLELAEQQQTPELGELRNQKQQIEKEIETTKAKLQNENSVIKPREKAAAQFREQLADISGQLKAVRDRLLTAQRKGLGLAIEAFNLHPSPAPMLEIILVAARLVELRPDVDKFCKDYIDKFTENKNSWAEQDGYRHRIEAARLASFHLENVARMQKDTKLAEFYADIRRRCLNERRVLGKERRW
jgi:hypothetical protein